jgi:hypothetical protein
MTSRERLLASIRHEEPDRVPVSPRIHAWLGEYYGDASLSTYLRFCEEFSCDADLSRVTIATKSDRSQLTLSS